MEVKEVMYAPRLEKHLLSDSSMEDRELDDSFKGGEVAFVTKWVDLGMGKVIRSKENNLYLLIRKPIKSLVQSSDNQSDIWQKRMGHLRYMDLPLLEEKVTSFLEFNIKHDGVSLGEFLGQKWA